MSSITAAVSTRLIRGELVVYNLLQSTAGPRLPRLLVYTPGALLKKTPSKKNQGSKLKRTNKKNLSKTLRKSRAGLRTGHVLSSALGVKEKHVKE